MIAASIGLGVFFVIQILIGLLLIFDIRVSDRVYLGLIMAYILSAGFVLGAVMA